jgi:glycosyltransferase involved in cell wall biosynthesis
VNIVVDMLNHRPKILFLTSRFPYPALSGMKLGILNVAKALGDCHLTLLSFCNSQEEQDFDPDDGTFAEIHKVYLPKWMSYGNVLAALPGRIPLQLAYYRSGAFQRKLEELLPQQDGVFAHLIRTGQYLAKSDYKGVRMMLMSDAISLAYQRMAELSGTSAMWHFLYRAELKRLLSYERTCTETFDRTWLHSDIDRKFLELNSESVGILPIGIDLEEFPFSPVSPGNVVAFVGNMGFSLNVDACLHFVRDIFPGLRTAADIRLRVIGACPASVKRKMERHAGVEVTGRVGRIADAVDGVFCGVCPVRGGAGIQNKVLNYLALGIPCVTSQVGLEGLDAVDGRDLLVYQKPEEATELILKLHEDSLLRGKLAANGRKFVEKNHDWRMIHRDIRAQVSELLEKRAALTGR